MYQHLLIVGGGVVVITFPATLDPYVLKAMLLKAKFLTISQEVINHEPHLYLPRWLAWRRLLERLTLCVDVAM